MTEIIMQAYHVLEELIHDPVYQSIKIHNQSIAKKYHQEILEFQEAKQSYDHIMSEGGTYHPDYKNAIKKLSEKKSTLYQKEDVKHYFKLEQTFQEKLNTFLSDMTKAVSHHIKTPDQFGMVTKGGSCHVR